VFGAVRSPEILTSGVSEEERKRFNFLLARYKEKSGTPLVELKHGIDCLVSEPYM
jgi:hypothetical protein